MPHPLEQGLRLFAAIVFRRYPGQSAPSIRTRIKTRDIAASKATILVRVPHPLEQGLRPLSATVPLTIKRVRVPHPLEQGLRPDICVL